MRKFLSYVVAVLAFASPALAFATTATSNYVRTESGNTVTIDFDITGSTGQSYIGLWMVTSPANQDVMTSCNGTVYPAGGSDQLCVLPFSGDGHYTFVMNGTAGIDVVDEQPATATSASSNADFNANSTGDVPGQFLDAFTWPAAPTSCTSSINCFLPSGSTVLAAGTTDGTDTFTYFWPVVGLILGMILGVLVVNLIIRHASRAARRVVGKGRRG